MKDGHQNDDSFTRDEMKQIRQMLNTDVPQLCPRCGGELHLEGPVAGGGSIGFVWRAACAACDVSNFVAESIARPPDQPAS